MYGFNTLGIILNLSKLGSKIYNFLSQCNFEYAIIGFIITILVLYAIHYLYKKGFSKGEASNTLPRIDLIKSTAERV